MSYKHFTPKERYFIYHLVRYGLTYREIGRRLKKHHTSISREVKRNSLFNYPYQDDSAQKKADQRTHRARHYRKRCNKQLFTHVIDKVCRDWSPEIISGQLQRAYPNDATMRISPEGIYCWVYEDARDQGTLYSHLVRHHKKRQRQHKYGSGRGLIPGRVSIAERPEVVAKRSRFGDWEGDTLEGAKGTGGLATHVERKSRYLITAKLSDKQAKTMAEKTIKAFAATPRHLRKTLTVDNGKEFAEFKRIQLKSWLQRIDAYRAATGK